MADERNNRIVTPEFRLSFPSVFERIPPGKLDEGKFVITMLFDKSTDLSKLKAAAKEAASAKWGNQVPKGLKSPFLDGDERDSDGFAGCTFIRAKTKIRPAVVDKDRQEIIDPSEVYSGCYCRASVVAYGYPTGENQKHIAPGVAFSLHAIQKLRDGEPLGGSNRSAALDFDDLPEDTKPNKPAAKAAPARNAGLDDW